MPVGNVQRLLHLATGGQTTRPNGESGHTYTAFVDAAFLIPERGVVADGRVGAVVGGEDNERFVAEVFALERGQDAADRVVHVRDHRDVRAAFLVGDMDELREPRLGGLERRVRGVEGNVKEQRFRAATVFLDGCDRLVRDEIGGVAFFAEGAILAMPVEAAVTLVRKVVGHAEIKTVLVFKPACGGEMCGRPIPEMPFAGNRGDIAGLAQRLRESACGERKTVHRFRLDDAELEPEPHRIQTGHQCRASGRADRLNIELLKSHTRRGELVQVRRLYLFAAVADVRVTLVVGQDENDVGPGQRLRGVSLGERQTNRSEGSENGKA